MPTFYYQALDANERTVGGELEAESLAQALATLEAQGLKTQAIGAGPLPPAIGAKLSADFPADAQRRSEDQRAMLQRHLASVMERAQELLPALQAYLQEMPNGRRRRELAAALEVIERGNPVQAVDALGALPGYWIPLLGAATASRDPGRILREFMKESEQASELARQWWKTLAYPAMLGALAFTVLTVLSIVVIPLFWEIFRDFELSLPPLTMVVLSIAQWIASGKILIALAALAALVWLLRLATCLLPRSTRDWWGDRLALPARRTTAVARFSQFAADLLEAELETPHAIRLAGAATGNGPFQRAADRMATDLERRGIFVEPGGRRILTWAVVHALTQRAPRASRIKLLREISAAHGEQASRRMSWTHGVIEPLAILVIGLVVGVVVLALFLPLFGLLRGLS
jgi:type IV pilus assembly protein PilC